VPEAKMKGFDVDLIIKGDHQYHSDHNIEGDH
jgi:hypothetical protein